MCDFLFFFFFLFRLLIFFVRRSFLFNFFCGLLVREVLVVEFVYVGG